MNDAELSQASSERLNGYLSDNPDDWDGADPRLWDDDDSTSPVGDPFVVVWEDGSVSSKSEKWVSETYDMADCDWDRGIKVIMATDQDGQLVPIRVGEQQRNVGWADEGGLYFANSRIYAGTRIVGHVAYTDH